MCDDVDTKGGILVVPQFRVHLLQRLIWIYNKCKLGTGFPNGAKFPALWLETDGIVAKTGQISQRVGEQIKHCLKSLRARDFEKEHIHLFHTIITRVLKSC